MRSRLGSGLLAFSATLGAQGPGNPAVLVAPPAGKNCPVSLFAQHTRGGAVEHIGGPRTPGRQGYQLTLDPAPGLGIRSASVTLHGVYGSHLAPAAESPSTDRVEHLTITPHGDSDHHFKTVVYTQTLSGVQWLELHTITYTDGTVWHASSTASCRAAPNGFLLVAGR